LKLGSLTWKFDRYPVFNKILATCPQQSTLEEYRTVIDSFEDFLDIMDEKGHIEEEHYNVCGIRMDKDVNGRNVFRTAGIAQESFQHLKYLTHSHQVKMRQEGLQIIKSKENQNKETANLKHAELVDANKKVVEIICMKLWKEGNIREDTEDGEEHMQLCTMKIVSELTNPQFEAFILACDTNIKSKSQVPTKGNLKEAEDNTVRNIIRVAFECRMTINKIEDVLPFDLSNQHKKENEDYHVHLISLTNDETVLPSTLLCDSLWVKYVIDFLDLERTAAATSDVPASDKEKTNFLLIKLCEKFKSHVKTQVKQAAKQNHWILKFAFKNLPVLTATIVLSKHLKIDLKCLSETSCLLGCNVNQIIPCLSFPRREGAYLYFDFNRGVFVRSGKVVIRVFQVRHNKHFAANKEEKSSSHFYFMYPSTEGKRKDKRDMLGSFEHLAQVIAACFGPTSEGVD
jgi:hypothetical protein